MPVPRAPGTPTYTEGRTPMANLRRGHRDRNTETGPERTARILAESKAELAKRAAHYAREAELAQRLAEQLRRGE